MTQQDKQVADDAPDVEEDITPQTDTGGEGTGGAAGGYGGPSDATENASPTSTEMNPNTEATHGS